MDPRNLSIRDFDYNLPEDQIAKYPLPERDASRILIYRDGKISEDRYKNLDQYVPAGSLLVFNDTKVVEARILFQKKTGGVIEIFCLEPHQDYKDISTGMSQKGKVLWQCMIGGASKWKHGQVLEKTIGLGEGEIHLSAKYAGKQTDSFVIEFSWNNTAMTFAEILHLAGAIPLPPYIKRQPDKSDAERYQTVYAHYDGSVAAPTAGLHFTNELLKRLKEKNIQTDFVTLHVGAGTFKPVKSDILKTHEMHAEFATISKKSLAHLVNNLSKNILAVGTTSLRCIESIYWAGVKLKMNLQSSLTITQWEPYELEQFAISPTESLRAVLDFMDREKQDFLHLKTQILIAPSYQTRIASALITNFHQPRSTLLLLVAAVAGTGWREIYEYALHNNFRFLSYGDGCLIWVNRTMREPAK